MSMRQMYDLQGIKRPKYTRVKLFCKFRTNYCTLHVISRNNYDVFVCVLAKLCIICAELRMDFEVNETIEAHTPAISAKCTSAYC